MFHFLQESCETFWEECFILFRNHGKPLGKHVRRLSEEKVESNPLAQVARALMYMACMYHGNGLRLVDRVGTENRSMELGNLKAVKKPLGSKEELFTVVGMFYIHNYIYIFIHTCYPGPPDGR